MSKPLLALCVLLSLGLPACRQQAATAVEPARAAATAAPIAAPIADAAVSPGAGVEPPQPDLLAFAAGTQVVAKPQDNQGLFQMDSDPINLIDEAPATDWTAIARPVPVVVFELPERTEIERLVFDSAGLNRDEKSPKAVKVELSDTGIDAGYSTLLEARLDKARNGQSFPVAAKAAGRWLRLSVASNFGDEYVGMTGLHAYGRQLTQDASLHDVSGTYDGWNGWGKVRLKQEGTRVTGCYEYRDGVIAGGIEGRLLKASMLETGDDGAQARQLGLFSFSPDGALVMGLARAADAEPGSGYATFYTGKKLGDDIGDCPRIPDWTGNAAQSQIGAELESAGRARLDGINFDFSSATMRPESTPLLKQVATLLNQHPDWTLTLEGHTDNVGGADYNQRLSERRAAAVVAYLVTQGVAAERLDSAGFGMQRPVASNDSEAGRAQNRRVEIVRK